MALQLRDRIERLNHSGSEAYFRDKKCRTDYLQEHSTRIFARLCSDGRLQFVRITKSPVGHICIARNIGAKFRMGWPAERSRFSQLVDLAWNERRRCLFIATYHFSRSHVHLGCAGNEYNLVAARATANRVRDEMTYGFQGGMQRNYAITVGIETDSETLIFHGYDGTEICTTNMGEPNNSNLLAIAKHLYPDMEEDIQRDLVPLMRGNIEHARERRAHPKPLIELDHTERVLAVGRGFDDWLSEPNLALIVDDSDPRLDDSIATGAGIILRNRNEGRIPNSHALNVVAVPYFHRDERRQAELHARYLEELCRETLIERHGRDADFFEHALYLLDWGKRLLEPIETL